MKRSELKKIIKECIMEIGVRQSGPHLMSKWEKLGKNYYLWQIDHYEYELGYVDQSKNKKVETFTNMSYDKVQPELKRRGYKKVRM